MGGPTLSDGARLTLVRSREQRVCGSISATTNQVWTQEKFPTLLRATSQGMTISFARVLAAVFALWTPMLLDLGPRVMFGTLAVVIAISTIIGYRVNRMPNALTPEPASEPLAPAEAR